MVHFVSQTNFPENDIIKEGNVGQAKNGCYFYSLSVRCWFCAVKCHGGWLIGSEVVTGVWCIVCGHSQTRKYILFDTFYGLCYKMCYSLCMWLAFIRLLLDLHSLWHDPWF